MKKLFFIIFISAIAIASCTIGPVPIYTKQPILDIITDTLNVNFVIPDTDASGWDSWTHGEMGADTVYINLNVTETKKIDAYITGIKYTLYVDNTAIQTITNTLLIPEKITDNDTISLFKAAEIIINEQNAYYIDGFDGYYDNVGTGIIEIQVNFEDENGYQYKSLPSRKPFTISK